ncbi:hypothetical protein [Aquirufa nivalisilvae]|uniref:hypothetical protein n=1 Tax=Aquirufa nivalisilvae TaxID=2516557 RepID=UPI0022A9AD0F|nr:hypothetical protein [Aquirufa nivalisilvae]MCZ2479253.1 hypothetical protein [Aquirufa nivalisilvae]
MSYKIDNLIDKYFEFPIIIDLVTVIIFYFVYNEFSLFDFELIDKSNQINIIPNIIAADVSLAGFILAALTIIVTFKSNIQSKGMNDATNALELIFSSKHYSNIVQVFKKSLVELIICFIFLFFSWLSTDNLSIVTINKINLSGIAITVFSISRSLFVLFKIMDMEKYKSSNK